MSEPPATYQVDPATLAWTINDAQLRMLQATTPDAKLKWARVYVRAKKQRGDYDLVQEPVSEETIDALARLELQDLKP